MDFFKKILIVLSVTFFLLGCNKPGYPDNVNVERIDTSKLQGLLITPKHGVQRNSLPRITAIVLGGSEGGYYTASQTAVALAQKGIAVVVVGYFGTKNLPTTLKEIPIEYVDYALDYIDSSPTLSRNHCGQVPIVGSSRGAELALLVGAHNDNYSPVIALSPSSHVWGAMGDINAAAWTFNGNPLSFVPRHSQPDYSVEKFIGLDYFKQDLNHPDAADKQIDASNIKGQVLLLAGDDDKLWPSATMAGILQKDIASKGVSVRVKSIVYPNAGHIISPGLPSNLTQFTNDDGQTVILGGTPEGNAMAQSDALKQMVNIIKAPNCYTSTASFNHDKLDDLRDFLKTSNTSSLVLMRGGKVIFEFGDIYQKHTIHSIRKPMLNALYGIYTDQGLIDLNASLFELRIDDITPLTEIEKSATVRELLQSRSGVYLPAAATSQAMLDKLPARGTFTPGEKYAYNNWDFNVAGAIFEKLSGQSIYTAYYKEIAKPLGMKQFTGSNVTITRNTDITELEVDGFYQFESEKSKYPAYHFRMSAYDMALFGQLYENYGVWNNKQIISRDWIERSTTSYSVTNPYMDFGYGMLWNVIIPKADRPNKAFYHTGVGVHMLGVYPSSDLVFVHRVQTETEFEFDQQNLYVIIGKVFDALEDSQKL
ncbi:acyl-CoA thioester hydrolase/BAAT C-terminal domain-containing protein [Psychrosphaera aquimarina]|uniref:Acyl-CoA thioester hydrolase/BAAT C-terminal domain-containing protein n=1 Tax=Psychrosphaera aquimarina TaxID=2044854 RepID=A0ABU3QZR4_9GAMM|nr:acyl-CoA thioester hydrolase/BAAT C-terminal domain-containing protein [Psychrosphaera aquimarina]MDU0112909.1 acyl-CoA thioester hydrolase/BAAT C-terminal domain-containing protein [Psychrosphaera aquimarina]